jgi:hypothetical protein
MPLYVPALSLGVAYDHKTPSRTSLRPIGVLARALVVMT